MYSCGGNVIVFWRCIPSTDVRVRSCVYIGGICGSCVLLLRKALFTLSIDTVAFLPIMSRVRKFVSA